MYAVYEPDLRRKLSGSVSANYAGIAMNLGMYFGIVPAFIFDKFGSRKTCLLVCIPSSLSPFAFLLS